VKGEIKGKSQRSKIYKHWRIKLIVGIKEEFGLRLTFKLLKNFTYSKLVFNKSKFISSCNNKY